MVTSETGSYDRVVVDLSGEEPISGVLEGDGRTRPFEGWLELLGALEAAHARAVGAREARTRSEPVSRERKAGEDEGSND